MAKATILFTDNDPDSLRARAEFLERAGYAVIRAATPVEARRHLEDGRIDLAILDIRLENDKDEKDVSGLTLAREVARRVPKILLTGFPTIIAAKEALRPQLNGLPVAVDFVAKQEGPEALIQAVERALAQYVRINWDLTIHFAEPQSFHGWVRQIFGHGFPNDQLDGWAQEIEKLVRRMFYEYSDVLLDYIPTGREGEVLAWVRPKKSQEEPIEGRSLFKCSTPEAVRAEKESFAKFARMSGVLSGEWVLAMARQVESEHFAATLYSPIPLVLEPVEWLAEYFQWHQADEVIRVLEEFFEKVGKTIYAQHCSPEGEKTLNALYREQVGLVPEHVPEEIFRKALDEIVEYMRLQHFVAVHMQTESETISFRLGGGELTCPDPTPYIYRDAGLFALPVRRHFSLGNMDGYNILVDRQGKARVTDWAAFGPAPLLSDFIALESKVRFEWIKTTNLEQICDFEERLSAIKPFEEPIDLKGEWPSDLDKSLKVVATLRRLAASILEEADPAEYQFGILFHAARLIVTDTPLDRKAHALMAASLICRSLSEIQ